MCEAASELFQIDLVWPSVSEKLQHEAMQFWSSEVAIPYEEASQRKSQLLAIARDDQGRIFRHKHCLFRSYRSSRFFVFLLPKLRSQTMSSDRSAQ